MIGELYNSIKTKILILDNIQDISEEQYADIYELLSEERKEKVNKLRFMKDKVQSISAYCLLKYGLKRFYDVVEMPNFLYHKQHKPYFKDSNIFFNLSHCFNAVCCAISYQEVGIDIQDNNDCYENILNYSMNSNEIAVIENSTNPKDVFYRYWTLKESYFKYIGTGISNDLNKIDFSAFQQERFTYKDLKFLTISRRSYCLAFCGVELPEVIDVSYQEIII
ncbi:hypothetical protein AXY43_05955 [Clostridium sp. MF28]|uniref:4'-phosphopantetheinyl transferase n=1 Tax=Clostridium diolis TaxID=223919 RepID=A0AAV3W4S7_9CLOT|nr:MULTISPECIES: 4'-phosphopantetheinyl transferase superfamily protein [Clostridium]AVK47608.1 hypothetical protein AXY43_05955 [Clostridium sp. MF28]PSM55318.1 hypothetical protein C4L39_23570 [Clostridium diolis]QES74621.1 4'-phosphopantetheinyl transferase superfamily protein [Clostridium diolis]GEA32986.1 4'-phosphopantetheinyl transferase [Clostridium diolis]